MTLRQLNSILTDRRRLASTFNSLLSSRNIIIDNFQAEYLRHKKLTAKKENSREALLDSLKRSRNMKKINKDFLQIKGLIKENQKDSKMAKKSYKEAQRLYEKQISDMKLLTFSEG